MENDSDHPLSDGDALLGEVPATTSGDSDEDVANGCGVNQSHPAATAASRTTLSDVSEEGHPPVSRPACTVPTGGNEGGNGLINNCDEEDEEEAEGEGNSLIPNSKSKKKSKSNSRSEVTTFDNRPTKLRKYTNTEDMSRGDFLEVFINSQSLEDDQDECLKFLRTLGSRGAASTKDLGSFVGMEPDLLTRFQWIELFEQTKKEGKTIKSQIRHPSSTDVKKLLPLRPAGTLTCGKPDILKTVYEGAQGIEEKVKAVIALLGGKGDGAYRVLSQSECLIADATDKDQHIHQDGQPTGSSPVIAVNILLYSEMGDDVKFNIVPKSHIVMNRLRRQELTLSSESKSLGHCEGFDYDGCGLLDSLRVEQVVISWRSVYERSPGAKVSLPPSSRWQPTKCRLSQQVKH
jgi:hypothetical protein